MREPKSDKTNDGWEELDHLVRNVLNALEASTHARPRPQAKPSRDEQSGNVIFKPDWGQAQAETAHKAGEHLEALESHTPPLSPTAGGEIVTLDVFNDEERKFIDDAVQWLGPRSNKDVILSRIWESLTVTQEESFYTAAEASSDNAPTEQDVATDPPDEA